MSITVNQIEIFLNEVDKSFPVYLSNKQDLHEYAQKLYNKATLCTEELNGRIISMVAGYTDNLTNNTAYITIVATAANSQNRGIARNLISRFISICKGKSINAVHLYAAKSNATAIELYKSIGFVEWHINNESRPDDIHLIYYIR